LQWLFNIKNPQSRLYRWSVRLSTYNFEVIHRKGKTHQHVDALSRAPIVLHITKEDIKTSQQNIDKQSLKNAIARNGIIYVKNKGINKIVIASDLKKQIIEEYHDKMGHPGINKTVKLISQFYWWKDSFNDIKNHINSCETCQLVKISRKPTLGHLKPLETPKQPMELIGMDTIVMGSAAHNTKAKYIQLVIDHHSRYVWAFATPTNTTQSSINILSTIFRTFGTPKRLLTDNGTNYTSKQFKNFLAENKVIHSLTSPYHPQTNATCEKTNGTIVEKLRIAIKEKNHRKWSTLLPEVVNFFNNTPHDSTGFTPRFLMFGTRDSPEFSEAEQITLEKAREIAVERTEKMKAKHKERYDKCHKNIEFNIGDLVKRKVPENHPSKNKITARNEGPFEILEKKSPLTYIIGKLDNEKIINSTQAHISQLQPFINRVQINNGGV
jgi:hypothetical protein